MLLRACVLVPGRVLADQTIPALRSEDLAHETRLQRLDDLERLRRMELVATVAVLNKRLTAVQAVEDEPLVAKELHHVEDVLQAAHHRVTRLLFNEWIRSEVLYASRLLVEPHLLIDRRSDPWLSEVLRRLRNAVALSVAAHPARESHHTSARVRLLAEVETEAATISQRRSP